MISASVSGLGSSIYLQGFPLSARTRDVTQPNLSGKVCSPGIFFPRHLKWRKRKSNQELLFHGCSDLKPKFLAATFLASWVDAGCQIHMFIVLSWDVDEALRYASSKKIATPWRKNLITFLDARKLTAAGQRWAMGCGLKVGILPTPGSLPISSWWPYPIPWTLTICWFWCRGNPKSTHFL